MEENLNLSQNELQGQKESPQLLLYLNICDLPLNKFIEVATTGNLYPLVISGTPKEIDLINAWAELQEQYANAIGDQETQLKYNLWKDINRLQFRINQVNILVSFLRSYYVPQFVTELNKLLYSTLVFDVKNKEEYEKRLKTAINKTKGFKIQLDIKLMEYNVISETKKEGEAVTKQYFQSVLNTIRKHEGYFVKDTDITVFEFCDLIKRFNSEAEKRK